MRARAATRQRAAMAEPAVAAEVHEPLDVHRHFAAQVAFDLVVAVDGLTDLQHFRVGQLVDAALRRDADLVDDLLGELLANAVNVLKRNDDVLVGRNVDAGYTSHILLFSLWDRPASKQGMRGAVQITPRPVEAGPCGSSLVSMRLPCPCGQASLM